jgi:ATP-binding protein involved in chromosome partitioning
LSIRTPARISCHALGPQHPGDRRGRVADVELGYPGKSQVEPIRRQVVQALRQAGARNVTVNVASKVVAHAVQRGVKLIPGIKNIVAVASGKGGVGKSTTAVNLALALAAEGASVGVLDADIYGPSQPMMLGIAGRPESRTASTSSRWRATGCRRSRSAFSSTSTRRWCGAGRWSRRRWSSSSRTRAGATSTTSWSTCPRGTGDIQLTLAQKVPVTGAVIVTTPQDIALIDARKGLKMFEKVGIPILGVVENMSVHVCPKCGHESHIFGAGGAEKMCRDYGTELLGQLPLDEAIRSQADSGKPTVVSEPDGPLAAIYRRIARRCAVKIAESQRDMTSKFPNIVVQNT